jgi:glycosyltransferase involved in cell wall biosynthesis
LKEIELTILLPVLNEQETIETVIRKAQRWLYNSGVHGEILVSDNGSTDSSKDLAYSLGARVIDVPIKGYGAALFHGAMAASGKYVIMGDADDSYNFEDLGPYLEKLRGGADLVMGNRFAGGIAKGAMPWKNKYIGNPVLSFLARFLFNSKIRDFHCGLRGFSKTAFLKMDLRTTGMEFTTEMVIKAELLRMEIQEVPTTLAVDGRSRKPHLRPWRDGWRHLRFMLTFSPSKVFIYPGLVLFSISFSFYVPLLFGTVWLGQVGLNFKTLFFAQTGIVLGIISMILGVIFKMFAARENLLPNAQLLKKLNDKPLFESGATFGAVLILAGLMVGYKSLSFWAVKGFGELGADTLLRDISVSTLLLEVGGLLALCSLVFGVLSLPTRNAQN